MSSADPWAKALPEACWRFTRVTREGRKPVCEIAVNGGLLAELAKEQQALLVDCCSARRAASLLCAAAPWIEHGTAWVLVVGDGTYHAVVNEAESWFANERWDAKHVVYDQDRCFKDAKTWDHGRRTLVVVDPSLLRESTPDCPRRRPDLLERFAPFVAVIDPLLSLCALRSSWDPAWVLRDLVARLCARQGGVPLVIFTEREAVSIGTTRLREAFGVSSFLFAEGKS